MVLKRKPEITWVEAIRFKFRLVAKGFSQADGMDYHEVFSHVVRHTSIRSFLAITAIHNLVLEQLDVKIAFFIYFYIYGNLEE